MNPLKVALHQIYILQLENYELRRFFGRMRSGLWRARQNPRKPLVWTPKAILLFVLGLFFQFLLAGLLSTWLLDGTLAFTGFVIFAAAFSYVFWIFLLISAVLAYPADYILKQVVVARGRMRLRALANVRVVAIAGSYGKTTFKNIAAALLSQSFKVVKTPDSVNTPVGVARWLTRDVRSDAQVLVVEFGEYYRGDIRKLCELIPPDVSVVTGINEAHLERLGSLENAAATIFEAVEYAKPGALAMLNGDDELVRGSAKNYLQGRKASYFGAHETSSEWQVGNPSFHADGSGWSFDLSNKEKNLGSYKIPLLGEYALSDILGAASIASELGARPEDIASGIAQVSAIPHRLQVVPTQNDILVIDDSYNANSHGVAEAIRVLGRLRGRRRIYVTPGLVETGIRERQIHQSLGSELAVAAELVVLTRNSVTPFIAEGLRTAGFPEDKILWFDTAEAAQKGVGELARAGDVILFQNDWTDNYI